MMRPTPLALAALAAALSLCGPTACTSTGSDSGLSQQFSLSNFQRADNTNGTQTRPDVNRTYTQPTVPTIVNRGN